MRLKLKIALPAILALPVFLAAQAPIVYTVRFPAPEHRWAQVEATFTGVAGTLEARMSRSSPGRYVVHEFAKNVFDVHAFDGAGRELTLVRPNPHQWNVAAHDGTVRILYKVYGDTIDGTYLAVDTTHAHMNLPALLMWARGFADRNVRVTFSPPPGSGWKAATQLYPTNDPFTFTAPNLQYLFDSPTELSAYRLRQFTVTNPGGRQYTIRAAVHSDASDRDVDEYIAGVEKIVKEAGAVFGEFPDYETGTYTFLADYLPWSGGDGMEHRNSTVVTGRSIRNALGSASHEFFHGWNVERIRPQGLEPFDFEDANLTDSLWLAEGFTQYYGPLIQTRAGLMDQTRAIAIFGSLANEVTNSPGRQFQSAIGMSQMAPFADGARPIDRTNLPNTFISYYTYGGAIALALDLALRDRSHGTITLDDFMRAMWRAHGKPGGSAPGLVGRPYSVDDVRDRLAEASGDRAFADEFVTRYIRGREVPPYATLLARAGVALLKRNAGRAWIGNVSFDGARISALVPWGSPAYLAGLEQDDLVTAVDGKSVADAEQIRDAIAAHKPGDTITVAFTRRGGPATATIALAEDPALMAVAAETAAGGVVRPEEKAFRDAWLGSRQTKH
jgi:predicted metalloprotease with PDZ domain